MSNQHEFQAKILSRTSSQNSLDVDLTIPENPRARLVLGILLLSPLLK